MGQDVLEVCVIVIYIELLNILEYFVRVCINNGFYFLI